MPQMKVKPLKIQKCLFAKPEKELTQEMCIRDRYGDDIAAVIAEDEIAAARAARLVKVEYEEYEPLLTVEAAMAEGATRLHEEKPGNVIAHSSFTVGAVSYTHLPGPESLRLAMPLSIPPQGSVWAG